MARVATARWRAGTFAASAEANRVYRECQKGGNILKPTGVDEPGRQRTSASRTLSRMT